MRGIMIPAMSAVMLAAMSAVQSANAQSGINSTVKVERNYDGRIASAVKSVLDAPVDDSLFNFRLNFDYTTFYDPYKDLYEFSPMMTTGPATEGRVVYPWFYAKVAAAYPWTPSADVYVTPRLGERFSFGVYFNHDSYWGDVPQVRLYGGSAVYDGQKRIGDRMNKRQEHSSDTGGRKVSSSWMLHTPEVSTLAWPPHLCSGAFQVRSMGQYSNRI